MKTKSRMASRVLQAESPVRHLPLADLLVDTKTEFLELALRSGRAQRRAKSCWAAGESVSSAHVPDDGGHGSARPPSRRADAGGRGHAPVRPELGAARPEMESLGTSKSAVSRRFVAKTAAQLATWQSAPLEALDLVGLLVDGVHLGDHGLIVALGIAADGQKHTPWGSGTGRRRMRPCARACWRISRVAISAPIAACSSSSMARRPCAKRSARPSGTRPSSSGVKSTRRATSSSISVTGSGLGRRRSCDVPTRVAT